MRKKPKKGDLVLLYAYQSPGKVQAPAALILIEHIETTRNGIYKVKGKREELLATFTPMDEFSMAERYKDTVLKHNATEEDLKAAAAAMRVL
jgi:hypothetical protein